MLVQAIKPLYSKIKKNLPMIEWFNLRPTVVAIVVIMVAISLMVIFLATIDSTEKDFNQLIPVVFQKAAGVEDRSSYKSNPFSIDRSTMPGNNAKNNGASFPPVLSDDTQSNPSQSETTAPGIKSAPDRSPLHERYHFKRTPEDLGLPPGLGSPPQGFY